jgi:hypothetical protein
MNNLRESQRKNKVCMCVCVCVRERERERFILNIFYANKFIKGFDYVSLPQNDDDVLPLERVLYIKDSKRNPF